MEESDVGTLVLIKLICEEEHLDRTVTDITVLDCLAGWESERLSSYDPGMGKAYKVPAWAERTNTPIGLRSRRWRGGYRFELLKS